MSTSQQVMAAKTLPPRLLRFFQKYPPPSLFPNLAAQSTPTSASILTSTQEPSNGEIIPPANDALSTELEANIPDAQPIAVPSSAPRNSRIPAHAYDLPYPNPFLPSKNFASGRWHGPTYGLRKQADLVKLAVAHDVVDLLPWTIKKPGEKAARRLETGLMVKGTGEGQRVKGKMWERTLKGRLEMRRQAMLNMPQMIQEWKQVSCAVLAGVGRIVANYLYRRDMDVVGRSGQAGRQRDKSFAARFGSVLEQHGHASIYEWRLGPPTFLSVGSSQICVYCLYDTRVADLSKQRRNRCYLDKVVWGYLGCSSLICNSELKC